MMLSTVGMGIPGSLSLPQSVSVRVFVSGNLWL